MATVGIIIARKGSEGIPGKNMVDLGGRPLLDYTLSIAEQCPSLHRIILSTNIEEAAHWAREHYRRIEIPFRRPENLSGARSSPVDVVLHAIDFLEKEESGRIETVVLLQPTCPFRQQRELEEAIAIFHQKNLKSLIGVSRVWHHPSDYVYRDPDNPSMFQFVFRKSTWQQRQDFPQVWFMTGALYICKVDYLRQHHCFYDQTSFLFPMSEETMVDIDMPFDLAIARGLVASSDLVS